MVGEQGRAAYSGDLLIPTKAEFIAYNLFLAAIILLD